VAASLFLLLLGFSCNLASAFTASYSNRWGPRAGRLITILLRDIFGIPIWVIGLGLAVATTSPELFTPTALTQVLAWGAFILGGSIILASLVVLGGRSIAPSLDDALVESGPYARVRHPIHVGTFVELIGLELMHPTRAVTLVFAIGCVWLLLQSRLEELDLAHRIPGYAAYMKRVPAFLPDFRIRGR
jgi:protein-S-isoprenylcysteine O-methyltransferase Ste14